MDVQEQRWLTAEEQRTWRALAGVAMRLPTALETQLQRDSGIGHFAYWVLAMLSEAHDRTLPMSELARYTNASQSRLSHAVSRLEQEGWVTRRPHPDNGRVTLARLSDLGLQVVQDAAPGHAETVARLVVGGMDEVQLRVLREVCEDVLARLDSAGASGCAEPVRGRMESCAAAEPPFPPTTTSPSSGAGTTG